MGRDGGRREGDRGDGRGRGRVRKVRDGGEPEEEW